MFDDFTYRFVDVPGYQDLGKAVYNKMPKSLYQRHGFWTIPVAVLAHIAGFKQAVELFGKWEDIYQIALVSMLPGKHVDEFPIHTDMGHAQALALNFPVYNCDKVYTGFYKSKEMLEDLEIVKTPAALLDIYPTHLMEEFDRYYLTQPAIINTSVPHTVVNLTDDIRLAVSVRWETDILAQTIN
jgi:hypothetical protein